MECSRCHSYDVTKRKTKVFEKDHSAILTEIYDCNKCDKRMKKETRIKIPYKEREG